MLEIGSGSTGSENTTQVSNRDVCQHIGGEEVTVIVFFRRHRKSCFAIVVVVLPASIDGKRDAWLQM